MTADTDTGISAQLGAGIELMLGRVADTLDRLDRREQQLQQWWQDLHPAPILTQALTGSPAAGATIDVIDRTQVKDSYWWDVRRLSCWGFTAGSVNVFLNDPNGEQIASFPQAGQWSWGGQLLMAPRDRLVAVVASNITGSVFFAGQVIEVASTILPQYLD